MACIYAFAMQLPVFSAQQHAQVWQQVELKPVADATLLVVGLGRVGSMVAALARRNGMGVIAIRSHAERTDDVTEVGTATDLPGFASRADYVVVCLPLTDATRGRIDKVVLDAMKTEAVLVNLSRGGIVDEAALLSRLRTQRLRGAALDVFAQEPLPIGHPFWTMPNVILTPHNAVVFGGWLQQAARHFCENLTRWRSDQPLLNMIPRR
jgi:phosphoglycerate dehydrogenase-like enzyme